MWVGVGWGAGGKRTRQGGVEWEGEGEKGKNTYGLNAHTNEQEEKEETGGVRSGLRGSFERGCFPASNSETRSWGMLQKAFPFSTELATVWNGNFRHSGSHTSPFPFFEHPLDANSSKSTIIFLLRRVFMRCAAFQQSVSVQGCFPARLVSPRI